MNKAIITIGLIMIIVLRIGAEGMQEEARADVRDGTAPVTEKIYEPESIGLDSEQLENIDRLIERYMEDKALPGAVVLVARYGKIAYHKAFGKADEGKPLTTDAIFRLASLSKPFVGGTGILQLMDRGDLMLSDPASRYFPGFAQQMILTYDEDGMISGMEPAKREISIHDLLTFTAGFPYEKVSGGGEVFKLYEETVPAFTSFVSCWELSLQERASLLAHMPLAFQPGEHWGYSNYSLDVLGAIVEQVSGKRFDRYVHEHLFGPLNMRDTYFYPPEEKWGRVTGLYYGIDGIDGIAGDVYQNGGEGLVNLRDYTFDTDPVYFYPGGGLHSTSYDVFRYFQMLLNGGKLDGVRVLSEHAVKMMLQDHIADKEKAGFHAGWGYCIGIQVKDAPTPLVGRSFGGTGSFSWNGYFGTAAFGNPGNDTVIVIMTHVWTIMSVWDLQGRIVNIVNRAVLD